MRENQEEEKKNPNEEKPKLFSVSIFEGLKEIT